MSDETLYIAADRLGKACERLLEKAGVPGDQADIIAQVVVEGIDAPQWFLGLASACILWWFGDRTVQHLRDRGVKESLPSREQEEQS